jgi:hypothetical protein
MQNPTSWKWSDTRRQYVSVTSQYVSDKYRRRIQRLNFISLMQKMPNVSPINFKYVDVYFIINFRVYIFFIFILNIKFFYKCFYRILNFKFFTYRRIHVVSVLYHICIAFKPFPNKPKTKRIKGWSMATLSVSPPVLQWWKWQWRHILFAAARQTFSIK